MDSIRDILADRVPSTPPEIEAIKRYVWDEFQREVHVTLRGHEVIINTPGASFANALRLRLASLQRLCPPDKRIVIRIKV